MKTLWHFLIGAKAGLVLLWRARRSGRSFSEQLEHETTTLRVRSRGSICDRCLGTGHEGARLCSHCLGSGFFTTPDERAALKGARP